MSDQEDRRFDQALEATESLYRAIDDVMIAAQKLQKNCGPLHKETKSDLETLISTVKTEKVQAQKQYPLSVNIIKKRLEDTADTAKVLISAKWWKAVNGDHFTDKAKLDLCLKAYEKKLELTAATKGPDLAVRLDETLKALDLVIRAAAMNIKSANTVTQKRTMT